MQQLNTSTPYSALIYVTSLKAFEWKIFIQHVATVDRLSSMLKDKYITIVTAFNRINSLYIIIVFEIMLLTSRTDW